MFNTLIFNKLWSNKQNDSVLHTKPLKLICLSVRTGWENQRAEMVFEEFYLFRTVKTVGFFSLSVLLFPILDIFSCSMPLPCLFPLPLSLLNLSVLCCDRRRTSPNWSPEHNTKTQHPASGAGEAWFQLKCHLRSPRVIVKVAKGK